MTEDTHGTWLPIDTAPANEPVLLYTPAGYYADGDRTEVDFASHGWARGDINNFSHHSYATHWMPLPKPPQIEGE